MPTDAVLIRAMAEQAGLVLKRMRGVSIAEFRSDLDVIFETCGDPIAHLFAVLEPELKTWTEAEKKEPL